MKLLKRSLVLLGCALAAAAAFTACELGLGDNDDRAVTNPEAISTIEIKDPQSTFQKKENSTGTDDWVLHEGKIIITYVDSEAKAQLEITDDNKAEYLTSGALKVEGFDITKGAQAQDVTVSYTEDGRTLSTKYTIKIVPPVKDIEVVTDAKIKMPLYIENVPMLKLDGVKVKVTYEDDYGTEELALTDKSITVKAKALPTASDKNHAKFDVTYLGKTIEVGIEVEIEEGIFLESTESAAGSGYIPMKKCGYTGEKSFGVYNTDFTDAVVVPVDSAIQTVFTILSVGTGNFATPNYLIKSKDGVDELLYLRTDNWANIGEPTKDSDWNWDTFLADVKDSTEYVTLVNKGDKIDLYLHFAKAGSIIHHQYYTDMTGNSDEVQFLLSGENTTITFAE